jgi:hypothetical protein
MRRAPLAFLTATLAMTATLSAAEPPNLVPPTPSTAPNYWCTWYAQNYWIGRGTDLDGLAGVTNAAARDTLNDHTVFNETDGWATTYLPRSRGDYIFLIDHGWQTKEEDERIGGGSAFFSLVADPRDFPRYADFDPPERLKRFNEDIKALGWSSLGLWTRGNLSLDEARTFVAWSKHAGITYWKIDGGDINEFNAFTAKQDLYPELVLEYVTTAGGNLNPRWDRDLDAYPSVYDLDGRFRDDMLRVLQHTDTFRTYDASPLLMTSTTLRRTHDILKQTQQQPKYRGILNVQDDCNAAVGLGVLVASKRHPNVGERTYHGRDLHHQLSGPRRMQRRTNEADRFARWSRIAPAFPAGVGTYVSSDRELIDRCGFTEWDTWAKATYGRTVSQSAPAVMARNMPLPVVETEGPPPFVCATTYPNGPTGIAAEGRVSPDNKWFEPRATVTVRIKNAAQPIGIVGRYTALVLEFAGPLDDVDHVWAQDLLADRAIDLRDRVTIDGHTLTVPGELIDEIGTMAGDTGDPSAPGLVLQLAGGSLPVAGDDFAPDVEPVTEVPEATTNAQGFAGTAEVTRVDAGYRVRSRDRAQVALRKLPKPITSGKTTITWTMTSVAHAVPPKRNGFIVLSSDDEALASIVAGAWIAAGQLAVFENRDRWPDAPTRAFEPVEKLDCQLVLDLDARTAELTINGTTFKQAFSESVTAIHYLGFGTLNAETVFTEPELTPSEHP